MEPLRARRTTAGQLGAQLAATQRKSVMEVAQEAAAALASAKAQKARTREEKAAQASARAQEKEAAQLKKRAEREDAERLAHEQREARLAEQAVRRAEKEQQRLEREREKQEREQAQTSAAAALLLPPTSIAPGITSSTEKFFLVLKEVRAHLGAPARPPLLTPRRAPLRVAGRARGERGVSRVARAAARGAARPRAARLRRLVPRAISRTGCDLDGKDNKLESSVLFL